jgi:hypothetical protein
MIQSALISHCPLPWNDWDTVAANVKRTIPLSNSPASDAREHSIACCGVEKDVITMVV